MAEITSKKQLQFYIQADRMMNRGYFKEPLFKSVIKRIYNPDVIMQYLIAMRSYSYYKHTKSLKRLYWGRKFRMLGIQLGFSICEDTFGYGLVIPHYGTIVVGRNDIGNYCVLHTSTCITHEGKKIGDGSYLSSGAKVISPITLEKGITVGANSLVNKDFHNPNMLLVGAPANEKKAQDPWYMGGVYPERVTKIERLRKEMGL